MVEGVNSSIVYLIHCKNLCKCHNVPLSRTTIKKRKNFKMKFKKAEILFGTYLQTN
jgi:hypothetical protein